MHGTNVGKKLKYIEMSTGTRSYTGYLNDLNNGRWAWNSELAMWALSIGHGHWKLWQGN